MVNDLLSVHFYVIFIFWMSYEYELSFFFFFLVCVYSVGRRQWYPTPVLLPGKAHGGRSLVGCIPRSRYELGMTEWLHFHFSLSRTGEGNGNPLQCSCLENPRDLGAWWAAVYRVAQSQTRLKWLSSSSSSSIFSWFSTFVKKTVLSPLN